MNSKLIQKLDELYSKHKTISDQLEDEKIYQDHALLKKLNQEFSKIDPIVKKYNDYKAAILSIKESEKILSERDKELRQMAEEDISANNKIKNSLEEFFENELVDKDPNDSRDAFVEIRAGTGGEEAAIFVGDLFKMYSKFSEKETKKVSDIFFGRYVIKGTQIFCSSLVCTVFIYREVFIYFTEDHFSTDKLSKII